MVTRLLAACLFAAVTGTASTLPSIQDTITVREWLMCGPFSVGMREGITGVVEDPARFRPTEGDSFRTALVQGGMTVCRKVKADSAGWVETDYEDVRWDSIQDFYGASGLLAAGYAYAELRVSPAAGDTLSRRAIAIAPKVGAFYLNGLAYQGDVYGTGRYLQPVVLV